MESSLLESLAKLISKETKKHKKTLKQDSNKEEKKQFQTQVVDIIFQGHQPADKILKQYREKKYGLYCCSVKWHNEGGPHTHVAAWLRDKPRTRNPYEYFSIEIDDETVKPGKVRPIGKGNGKLSDKFMNYVNYLTDGHDNGTYKDYWHYKYDHELLVIPPRDIEAYAMCLLNRGLTFDEIYKNARWERRAQLLLKKKKIIRAWRMHKEIMEKPEPIELRPWQAECLSTVKEQNDRKLLWIVDPEGNNGKTRLCKEMALHHDTAVFNNAGKKDIAFAYDDQPIVAFNLTRTCEERVNYEAMESLKDGLFFSAKYESQTKVFTPPKLLVMSNFPPDKNAMSQDRWEIYALNEGRLTKLP